MIDPRALRTFGAVCRAGSISAAARDLNISQPSVSNAIAQLESRLGVTLFERGRGGVSLTAEGKALKRHALALQGVLGNAEEDLRRAREGMGGTLRVGGTPGALVSLLPKVIDRVEDRAGPFALHVVERSDTDLLALLRSREIELAFVTTEIVRTDPDIREITMARDAFSLIVGPANAALPGRVSLRSVQHMSWVLPEAVGAFRRQVDALFVAAEVPNPHNAIRCDSLLTTKAIVRNSPRITILPRTVVAPELASGSLRAIELDEAGFERSVGIRMLADVVPSRLAGLVVEELGRL